MKEKTSVGIMRQAMQVFEAKMRRFPKPDNPHGEAHMTISRTIVQVSACVDEILGWIDEHEKVCPHKNK